MSNFIETNDLLLRHATKEDTSDFVGLVTKPAYGRLSPFGSLSAPMANSVLDTIISDYEKKKTANEFWTVVDKKQNAYAGFVGYQPVVFDNTLQEMFFVGFLRKFWGSDLPLHATIAACKYAFNAGQLARMIAFVHPEDVESIFIAQTLGSQFEKECLFFDATVLLFSLTPSQIT